MVKAVSFDFWETLYTPNAEFRIQQAELFREFLPNLSVEEWANRRKQLKAELDILAETKGNVIPRLHAFQRVLKELSKFRVQEFVDMSDDLFLMYPPIPTTAMLAAQGLEQDGFRIFISSNTIFIGGDVLIEVLKNDLDSILATHCNFSDVERCAKPDLRMFEFSIGGKPLVHIGDNLETDGACVKVGIPFIHYNKRENLKVLIDNIQPYVDRYNK